MLYKGKHLKTSNLQIMLIVEMMVGGQGLMDRDHLWLPTIWGFVGFGARLRWGLWDRGHAPWDRSHELVSGSRPHAHERNECRSQRRKLCGTWSWKLRGPRPGWIWTPGWRGSRRGSVKWTQDRKNSLKPQPAQRCHLWLPAFSFSLRALDATPSTSWSITP